MTIEIAYLRLSSYAIVGGRHYYATLSCGRKEKELVKTLTAIEAATLNRRERGFEYEDGDTTGRFRSRDEAIAVAREKWRESFPNAKVLISGRDYVSEPQLILDGLSEELRERLNGIYQHCEELGWWDGGYREAVEKLSEEWCGLFSEEVTL